MKRGLHLALLFSIALTESRAQDIDPFFTAQLPIQLDPSRAGYLHGGRGWAADLSPFANNKDRAAATVHPLASRPRCMCAPALDHTSLPGPLSAGYIAPPAPVRANGAASTMDPRTTPTLQVVRHGPQATARGSKPAQDFHGP
jgi:hypothetical protein